MDTGRLIKRTITDPVGAIDFDEGLRRPVKDWQVSVIVMSGNIGLKKIYGKLDTKNGIVLHSKVYPF